MMRPATLPLRFILLSIGLVLLSACAATSKQPACPDGTQDLPDCPPQAAIDDPEINALYEARTWVSEAELGEDLIELGKNAEIPVQQARTKFLGPNDEAAITSLAVKLWMIENAEHTIDFTYYIFKTDLVGNAMLGALCNAVRRGVDVRVTVDSLGSISGGSHSALRALETCADDAGFMRNSQGQLTTKKARVQVVIFNAVTKLNSPNRRSHDKLLVKDGSFEGKAVMITGGRNISGDYYGIQGDGTPDPDPFRDAEILIRGAENPTGESMTVGELSESYSSILFLLHLNKRIKPVHNETNDRVYANLRAKSLETLKTLKGYEYFRPHYEGMMST